jgi:putative ubiquitin-RnfH superfamily antitoxin RatB of RatAB toxin-antitoxin module
MIRVTIIRAWPRRFESVVLELPDGATVGNALIASGLDDAGSDAGIADGVVECAVFGVRLSHLDELREGDRLEILRPLLIDPKDARRRRAKT